MKLEVRTRAGQNVANELVAGLSAQGSICIFTSSTTDVIVDVVGYM